METNDFIDLCMQAYFALIQVFAHNISRQRDLIQTVIEDFCILLDEVGPYNLLLRAYILFLGYQARIRD